jgi:hypothetical protein
MRVFLPFARWACAGCEAAWRGESAFVTDSAREPFRRCSFRLRGASLGPCVPTSAVGWQLGPSSGFGRGVASGGVRCVCLDRVASSSAVRPASVVGPAELVVAVPCREGSVVRSPVVTCPTSLVKGVGPRPPVAHDRFTVVAPPHLWGAMKRRGPVLGMPDPEVWRRVLTSDGVSSDSVGAAKGLAAGLGVNSPAWGE